MFSHDTHLDGVSLACTDCHDKLYLSTRSTETATNEINRKRRNYWPVWPTN